MVTNKLAVEILDNTGISVVKSLQGKHVLVTGTTGFVGKVIIEKLMRDVPEIGGIYLLIRGNKKHPKAEDRFTHEIATSSVFEKMQSDDLQRFEKFCHQKIHCITGEITEQHFGLNTADFNTLMTKVDVVINSAASVNFREELDQALSINALSLYNIAEFSRLAGDIPVLQVSTCYVNGFNQGDLVEDNVEPTSGLIPYDSRGYYKIEGLLEELQKKISVLNERFEGQELADKLIELGITESNRFGWNDTYTFTKWMGEQILRKSLSDSALTILRPAIVESTLIGPVPGWIEGVKVADAILMAYAREKVTFFPGDPDGIIDIIPADLVANSIILGVAELLHKTGDSSDGECVNHPHRVYQCCSSGSNPVTIDQMIKLVQQEADDNYQQYEKLFYRKPKRPFMMVSKRVFLSMMSAMKLLLMAVNKVGRWFGQDIQTKTLSNIETAMNLSTVFSFYSEPKYRFHNEQLIALSQRVSEADRSLFPVDAKLIDWERYIRKIHIPGLNRYALKERKVKKASINVDVHKSKAA
ncbi:fatty acyl-CoA reductase [Alkalimarinus sediminis]|uniref:Fatty acyl-CoA reductase n=1 Tax=Alkalimarinus sediminis TaxID=1632866 RepID=A0A9E8KQ97_9ALTE|nr:fatty acyl-CoA reductase [Alkalimarinus sediminis]UZW75574.1 fatty acyl-CoA reductase [Alkalimarinus sediminis]